MRILPYYIFHTIKNSLKKLFKTWVAIFLAVCLLFGVIGGIVGVTIGSFVDESTDSSVEETIEEEPLDSEMTADEILEMQSLIRGIIILISLLVILFSVYNGDKSGASIFTMPDVNFLFSSSVSPQSVLMFRTILQMGIALVSSLYLIFQLPNLILNVGLSVFTCISIIIAYFFLLYFSKITSVFTYTVTATYQKLRKFVRPVIIFAIVLILFSFYIYANHLNLNYFEAFLNLFSTLELQYIPLIGWISGMIFAAVNNEIAAFLVYMVLLIILAIISTVLIWRIKADFYEDALSGANEIQERLNVAQNLDTVKRKKERNPKIKRNGNIKGNGAIVFFTKTLYNRRRFAKFGFLTPTAITYSLVALVATFVLQHFFNLHSVLPLGFALLVFIFFRNFGNPIADEMSHDFIYTVPEKPTLKLWYSMLGGIYETVSDLILPLIISFVFLPSKALSLLLWFILWLSLELFCSSVGLFIEMVLPCSLASGIKASFALMLRMLVIVPGLILVLIGAFADMPWMLVITILINVIVSIILNLISPNLLHTGKK